MTTDNETNSDNRYTILVAEDDHAVRMLARRTLERFGYDVVDEPDGMAALETFLRDQGTIDLLLTDLIMPRMSGKQLARELLTHQPMLPILYFSGFTDDAVLRPEQHPGGVAFLSKPFTAQDLIAKVRELLDGASKS